MGSALDHADHTADAPITLLIADDDPVARTMLSISLARRFELAGVVEDAEQAVAAATHARPDVAIVDVQMPGGGGLAAVRGIVQASPHTAVVMLSSDESDESVRALLTEGAACYVRKGVDADELTAILMRAIRAQNQPAAGH
ncbi:MAG: response regulator transcription factor [Solirubrobacterales bacterium]|nr:response regulator transcription factor [Solirubrobacterales bacterium]